MDLLISAFPQGSSMLEKGRFPCIASAIAEGVLAAGALFPAPDAHFCRGDAAGFVNDNGKSGKETVKSDYFSENA